jgi:GT2 family glycosyltransferase
MLFDEERHFEALESLSLRSLFAGDLVRAYRCADRRCRIIPLAETHHYTLRGEISYRMGHLDAALADIARALELAPNDLSANRRMLAWGSGQAQRDTARHLLTIEPDFAGVGPAIAVLRRAGQRTFAAIKATDNIVTGWAVWDRSKFAQITIGQAGGEPTRLIPDPRHPLAAKTANAANFTLDRPPSRTSQLVSLYAGRTLIHQIRLRPNTRDRSSFGARSTARHRPPSALDPISIIVPVYADFEATEACFVSLMPEIRGRSDARIIVVDDASKDLRIKRLVKALAKDPRVRLLTNGQNQGFAVSVNRALAETKRGDVILLNADTVVPPGFITRLEAASHSTPEVGTVTPLSNNGELTSFPVPFRSNPLGSYEDVCDIDKAAAAVNAGQITDMPNGIGFCLYVTRACLDAVGFLSNAFNRGYFEDVDLCLRAREFGFRNVCAASVYVGHVGSRSFGTEKHALVVRNLATIKQWFPNYRPECAAFVRADPLRPARAAIERSMAARNTEPTLLVTGPDVIRSVVDVRAQDLTRKCETVLIVEVRAAANGPCLSIVNASKCVPQSLTFQVAASDDRAEALDYLKRAAPTRIEIADPSMLHLGVLDLLLQLDCPVDLFITNAGLVCPRGSFIRPDGCVCDALWTRRPCDECLAATAPITEWGAETISGWAERWAGLISQTRRVYAPGPHAKSFAARLLRPRTIIELKSRKRPLTSSRTTRKHLSGKAIGFVAVGASVQDYRLMKDVARALNRGLPDRCIVVIGKTIDDTALMRLDNVHVTGPVELHEHDRILRQYEIGAIFIPLRQPLFGHPVILDFANRIRTASFDWSFGGVFQRPTDLALNPVLNNEEIIGSLTAWLSKS